MTDRVKALSAEDYWRARIAQGALSVTWTDGEVLEAIGKLLATLDAARQSPSLDWRHGTPHTHSEDGTIEWLSDAARQSPPLDVDEAHALGYREGYAAGFTRAAEYARLDAEGGQE